MAIFHCQISKISRSKGQSAVEAAAYALHADFTDARTGERHCKILHAEENLIHNLGSFLPSGDAIDPEKLWNEAEKIEKRKDSLTARTFEVALPRELTFEEQKLLAQEFASWLRQTYGMATTAGLHLQHQHNPHAHIVASRRTVDENGDFKNRLEVFDKKQTGSEEYKRIRKQWEVFCNEALEKAGYDIKISSLSLKDQGIEREPQRHRGIKQHSKDLKEMGLTRNEYASLMLKKMEEDLEKRARVCTQSPTDARGENSDVRNHSDAARQCIEKTGRNNKKFYSLDERTVCRDIHSPRPATRSAPDGRSTSDPADTRSPGSVRERHHISRHRFRDSLAKSLSTTTAAGACIAERITALRYQRAYNYHNKEMKNEPTTAQKTTEQPQP